MISETSVVNVSLSLSRVKPLRAIALIAIASVAFKVCLSSAAERNGPVTAIAHEWKAHFAETPVIENCVFERHSFSPPPPFVRTGRNDHNKTNVYQFRYQADAFLIREITTFEDVASDHISPRIVYAGRFRSNYWSIGAGGVLKLFPDADVMMQERNNGDAALVLSAESMIRSPLYYGISDLDPTTVKWREETKFTALSITGEKCVGQILQTSEGLPTVLQWHFEKQPGIQFVLEYKYDVLLGLSYFPNEIVLSMVADGKKTLGAVFRILLLKTSPKVLPEELFQSARYFGNLPTYVFSTNDIYAVTEAKKGKQLQKVLPLSAMPPDSFHAGNARPRLTKLLVIGFMTLSLVGLYFLWKRAATKPD